MNCEHDGFNKGQSLYTRSIHISTRHITHSKWAQARNSLLHRAAENMFYWNATKIKCQNSWKCCGVIKVLVWGRNVHVQNEIYSLYRNKRQSFAFQNCANVPKKLLFHIKSARVYSYNLYFLIRVQYMNSKNKYRPLFRKRKRKIFPIFCFNIH